MNQHPRQPRHRIDEIEVEIAVELQGPRPDRRPICIAGNHPALGDWQPGKFPMHRVAPRRFSHRCRVRAGTVLEFKITRGSWKTQALYDPADEAFSPSNRTLIVGRKSTQSVVAVAGWLDQLPVDPDPIRGELRQHRGFKHPHLLHDRDLLVWLPPSYGRGQRRYPVIYMHDGQNLFDPAASFCGQDWKVDETVTDLAGRGEITECIVVGITNTPDRMQEYDPFTDLGQAYMNFVVEQARPFVERQYRTLTGPEHTAVMGSSMGGLISFYLAWTHPEVFSMAGCLSPAFWKCRGRLLARLRDDPRPRKPVRFYLDTGELEPPIVRSYRWMARQLTTLGYREGDDLLCHFAAGANHSEAAWAARLSIPLRWFFGRRPTTPATPPDRGTRDRS